MKLIFKKTIIMKNYIKILFCFLVVGTMITSCSKENVDTLATDNVEATVTIENDLMIFKDITSFEEFYNEKDALYDRDYEKYINDVEAQKLLSVFKKFRTQTITDFADIYQPWLGDPVMQGIVNEHLEFQIGDVLLTYASDDYILASAADDMTAKNEMREMGKAEKFDRNVIPANTYLVASDNLETLLGPWGTTDYLPPADVDTRQCPQTGDTGWEFEFNFNFTRAIGQKSQAYTTWSSLKEETRVVSWQRTSSGWQKVDTQLYAHVWATRRNDDGEGCSYAHIEDEVKTCDSCDDKTARVNTWKRYRHVTGDVPGSVSSHYIVNGAQSSLWGYQTVPF